MPHRRIDRRAVATRWAFIVTTLVTVLAATPGASQAVTWSATSTGELLTGSNWTGGVAPNGIDAVAIISTEPTIGEDFFLNGPMTLGQLSHTNPLNRSLKGSGTLTFESSSGNALYDAQTFLDLKMSSAVLASTTEFRIGNGVSVDVTSNISGSGGIIKSGSGELLLTGSNNNTYGGATTINDGTLRLGTDERLPNGTAVTVNAGATFDFDGLAETMGSLAGSGNLDRVGNLYTGGDNTSTTFSGVISGPGGVAKQGSGTMTLSGSNSYSGGTVISGGTLSGNTVSFGGSNSAFGRGDIEISNGSTLQYTGTTAGTDRFLFLNTLGGVVDVSNSGTSLFAQNQVVGVGTLTKSGPGELVLNNTNFYQGSTVISGGTLTGNTLANAGSSSAFGLGNFHIYNGATLRYAGASAATNRIISLDTGGGSIDITNAGTLVSSTGLITGVGGLTKTGNGQLAIYGANDYAGGTTINAGQVYALNASGSATGSGDVTVNGGILWIGFGGTAGSVSGNITNNGWVEFYRSDASQYDGQISGTGNVEKFGTGTLTLTGSHTYTGSTYISQGTLKLGDNERLPDASRMFANDVFDLNSFNETIGSLEGSGSVLLSSGNLTVGGNNLSTLFSGVISGSGGISKSGAGTLTLSGNNSYSGDTIIAGGTLSGNTIANIGSNSAFGQENFAISNGATLQYTSSGSTNRTISLGGGGGVVDVTIGGNVLTMSGAISGADSLTKTGAGQIWLSAENTYTGGTTVNQGIMRVLNTTGSATGSGDITIGSFGELSVGVGGTAGAVSGNIINNGALSFIRSDDMQYGGQISGIGFLVKWGAGTLTLTGNNSYSNITWIIEGTVSGNTIANNDADSSFGRGNFVLQGGGTLQYTGGTTSTNRTIQLNGSAGVMDVTNSATTLTVSAQMPNAGGNLIKQGAGTLTLTADNFYPGGTTINGGTLAANNTSGSATGTGAVTINSGMLAGTGSISGPVTVNSAGTLAPGASVESLDIGTLTMTSGSIFQYELNSTTQEADLLNVNGDLSLGDATLTGLELGAGTLTSGTKFTLMSYSGAWDTTIFAGIANNSDVTIGTNTFKIKYDDTTGGTNFGGGAYTNFVTLTIPGVGDYNSNGTVDAADYVVWRKNDGTQAGYDEWRNNFGNTSGSGNFAGVPEPPTTMLLAFGVVFLCTKPRQVGDTR